MTKKLHGMTKRAIQKLSEETSHQISLDDFDDILALNEIADKVIHPHTGSDDMAIANMPVRCGNVYLSRPKIGAVIWIQRKVCEWFADDQDIINVASVYCLAHGDNPKELWKIESADECYRVLE